MAPVVAEEARRTPSRVSAELFTIPLDSDRFLIYAPLRRAAFVANTRVVNVLADLQEEASGADPDSGLAEFLRRLEILDGGPEPAPSTEFAGVPEPTEVTLFLTTT